MQPAAHLCSTTTCSAGRSNKGRFETRVSGPIGPRLCVRVGWRGQRREEDGAVQQESWMNEQVQEELADLRRRFGFEEEEALAFWHRRQAGALMNEKRDVDLRQELDRVESQEQLSGVDQQATFVTHVARWHAGVYEYLAALNR